MKYKDRKRIIANGYVMVEKESNLDSGKQPMFENLDYEHRLVAEEMLGRPLKEGEAVHHLDENKTNNSPDNLLVLSNPMHVKLHNWLNKLNINYKPDYEETVRFGCVRCLVCEKPIESSKKFCSPEHYSEYASKNHTKYSHPTKEQLQVLIWSKPTTQLAKDFGVSDKAIEKLCKKLEVQKPPRGFWMKKNKVDINET